MSTHWDDLRFFLAVAETGSLTAAAQTLGSSQPTLSRRIKELETALGARLLRRGKDRYTLTPLGETVYERARRMEDAVFEIERHAGNKEVIPQGRVRIATTECIASSWLVRQLPEFGERFPLIVIEILTGISTADLMRKEADIALRVGISGPEQLHSQKVGSVEFGIYASERYLAEHGAPRSIEDLADHVTLESLGDLSGLPQVLQLRQNSAPTSPYGFDSILTQARAARVGLGVMVLPKYLSSFDGIDDELQRLFAEEFSVRRDLWLITHPDLLPTARYDATWRYLVDALDEAAGLFG